MGKVRIPRTGLGFDVHRFEPGRPLWLGGVLFEGDGLAGHSDGDVVCHALADAMLGAAALGDLGEHFPDTDPSLAGVAGTALLQRVVALLDDAGWSVSSCDLTVIGHRPAIAQRRDEIRARLAEVLGAPADHVSVKGTRPEGLGLVGDGIGCLAVAVLA